MVKKVSYLGPEGTWSEICSKMWFPDYETVPCISFEEALEKAEDGQSDVCVIPVENSSEGPVTQVFDMIMDSRLEIVGERIMNIRHSLLSNSSKIRLIYSHPQALSQCKRTIHKLYPLAVIEPVSSTARMWKEAASREGVAIIGSPWIASRYGIRIIKSDVTDYRLNLTRFIAMGRYCNKSENKTKASIYFSLISDSPGSLVSVLHSLSKRSINLSMVVSRPDKNHPGSYKFFIDCTGFSTAENLKEAIDEMRGFCTEIQIKGIYEASDWKTPDF